MRECQLPGDVRWSPEHQLWTWRNTRHIYSNTIIINIIINTTSCSTFNTSNNNIKHKHALYSAPKASALQLLKSETRSLRLFMYVSALIVFVVISRATISSTTSMHPNPVSVFLIASQLRHLVTVMRVYKFICLFTYLLTVQATALR